MSFKSNRQESFHYSKSPYPVGGLGNLNRFTRRACARRQRQLHLQMGAGSSARNNNKSFMHKRRAHCPTPRGVLVGDRSARYRPTSPSHFLLPRIARDRMRVGVLLVILSFVACAAAQGCRQRIEMGGCPFVDVPQDKRFTLIFCFYYYLRVYTVGPLLLCTERIEYVKWQIDYLFPLLHAPTLRQLGYIIILFLLISCSGSLSYHFPEAAGPGTINCTAGPNPRCNATINSAFLADRSWYISQDKAYYGSFLY